MMSRTVVCLLIYGFFIGCMVVRMHSPARKEIGLTVTLIVLSLFFALSFVMNQSWININDVPRSIFLGPVTRLLHAWGEK